ncbi:MAG: response regulator [Anaerolineae bacterium]|nr:response regulator [Anaerolineae bacterium]
MALNHADHTILIIDDDAPTLKALVSYLQGAGFKPLAARSGERGLDVARRSQPDLILLDVMMPGLDGFETCRRLKAEPTLKDIPIIFLTALSNTADKIRGFEAGAVDYITKPIQNQEVLARISAHLRLRQLTRRLEQKVQEQTQELTIAFKEARQLNRQLQQTNDELACEVAERKQIEEALKESQQMLQLILDHFPARVFWKDKALNFLGCNQLGAEAQGLSSPDEIIGKNDFDFFPPEEAERYRADDRQVIESGQAKLNFEEPQTRPDGSTGWLRTSKVQLRNADGAVIGVLGTCEDITDYKQTQEELKQYRERLEELVKERTRELEKAQAELVRQARLAALGKLTTVVSHEIRNPLSTIRASAFALDRKMRDKGFGVELALDRIQRNVTRCDNIIAELLDYTRSPELNLQTVCFDAWLKQVLAEQIIPADITLAVDLAANVDVLLDLERFRRVIVNLVDNACQAMPAESSPERPEAIVRIQSAVEDKKIKLSIIDNGAGIPPEVRPRIFEPLYSTKGFGVGLGLPIVNDIVKQHEGEIEVNSEVGRGTQMIVWLPLLASSRLCPAEDEKNEA